MYNFYTAYFENGKLVYKIKHIWNEYFKRISNQVKIIEWGLASSWEEEHGCGWLDLFEIFTDRCVYCEE